MKFGIYIFPTDFSAGPAEIGRAVEERGFESLFFPEHTHIPASRKTPFPGGGDLPPEYSHCLDPFVALTAAAAVTTTLKVGTGICLVIERDPITLAKAIEPVWLRLRRQWVIPIRPASSALCPLRFRIGWPLGKLVTSMSRPKVKYVLAN